MRRLSENDSTNLVEMVCTKLEACGLNTDIDYNYVKIQNAVNDMLDEIYSDFEHGLFEDAEKEV